MKKNNRNNKDSLKIEYQSHDLEHKNKCFNKFVKIVMGFNLSVVATLIFSFCGIPYILLFVIITIITVPITYIATTKIKEKLERISKRDMYEVSMLGKYLQEAMTVEHIIDEKTTYFMHEIGEYQFPLDINNLMNINQLLFLINQSYYENINKYGQDLSRHELVIKILDQVSYYYENMDKKENLKFDYEDAEKIIKGCIFIPSALQMEILTAFSKARVESLHRISFVIEPKDKSILNQLDFSYFNTEEYYLSRFDVNNINDYEKLMYIYQETEDINLTEDINFKDALLVKWDLEAIRDVMSLIVRRFGFIIEKRENELYHFKMTASFFCNLCVYASLNKVPSVGIREIINTFKDWNYFDFNLKLDILDAIFEEFDLDYSLHPYRDKKKNNDVGKVYHFPSNGDNKK